MDVLFDAVERLSEKVRRRWPKTLLTVGLILWALVTAAICWAATLMSGGPVTAIVLAGPPAALLILVGRKGIDRLVWPLWPLGVALPVFLAGVVTPQAPRFEEPFTWLAPVLIFIYAQIFLSTVATADEVHRRRLPVAVAMGPVGRRRILQTKILVAMLVVFGTNQFRTDAGYDPADVGHQLFSVGFGCLGLPMVVGVWLRLRGLAWYAAGVLPVVFALSLLPRSPDARWQALLTQGWIVLTATWLWARAARQPYWKWPPPSADAT